MKRGTSEILVNGEAWRSIVSKRGLRQGDTLSPLIFVLATDSFTKMLSLAVQNPRLAALAPNNYMDSLLSFQYEDDTLLFIDTSMENIKCPTLWF